ncbi:pyridoxal-phosphate dependent enzyme [Mycena pura]|uniref:Pyridoxal-phosphate dependent enzyme n=1 Tax=Mycena pura TaxID=153505 RepID=A0AAD6UV27_9AGAR|nr:pyridoxal-phosphate dependent enzyme [Mycena pura]
MADPSTSPPLTRASVQEALKLIGPYIHKTPVLTNTALSKLASTPRTPAELEGTPWAGRTPAKPVIRLWFKCENFQRIGAFKIRGAFHAIERLKREPAWADNGGREKGLVTHSSGNHAQALALAARENNIPAYIVMPTISAAPKIAATKGYGAHVIFSGSTSVEREAAAAKVIQDTGARLVPPYDHPDIILGQGTLGLELQDQVSLTLASSSPYASLAPASQPHAALNAIITPCGGGGMLSGVALSCEATGIRVFGAEPSHEGADDCTRGYYAGKRIENVKSLTIADGLRTPVGLYPWSVIYERRLVSGMYSVSETQIVAALRLVYERCKLVVEPSAVVGLAVALYNEDFRAMVEKEAGEDGWDLGVVFSGGNVDLEALSKLFSS